MERYNFKCLFLLWIGLAITFSDAFAKENPEKMTEVSLRFDSQWEISKVDCQVLNQKFGAQRVNFDPQGKPTPQKLSMEHHKRWYRLYHLCMSDGCYYCDASEGSCETGTCGPNNVSCKPYMDSQGYPKCGHACADYAFAATLY